LAYGRCGTSTSPHVAEDLAADSALARLAVGEEPLARRKNGNAEATQHTREAVGLDVHAQAWLRHSPQPRDDRLALFGELQIYLERAARAADVAGDGMGRSNTSANASFSFEDGMRTESWRATVALRIRVSMSAIGSVMVIGPPPSPTGLPHTGDFAGMDHLAKADPAQPELAEDRARPPAAPAPRIGPDLELGLALLLLDECLLGH
jgi:hypothetical protein